MHKVKQEIYAQKYREARQIAKMHEESRDSDDDDDESSSDERDDDDANDAPERDIRKIAQ